MGKQVVRKERPDNNLFFLSENFEINILVLNALPALMFGENLIFMLALKELEGFNLYLKNR